MSNKLLAKSIAHHHCFLLRLRAQSSSIIYKKKAHRMSTFATNDTLIMSFSKHKDPLTESDIPHR
jgi:hypothetical protein